MSAPADMVESPRRRRARWALLVVLALSAALVLGVMAHAASGGPAFSGAAATMGTLFFAAWGLGPFVVAGVLVVLVLPRTAGAMLPIALATAAVTATAVWGTAVFLTSESSTAALIFLWLPVHQLLAGLVAAALGGGLSLLLRRRAPRTSPAGGTSTAR